MAVPGVRLTFVLLLAGLGAVASLTTADPAAPPTPAAGSPARPALRAAGPDAVLNPVPDAGPQIGPNPARFNVRAENRHRGSRAWRLPFARTGAPGLALTAGARSVAPGDAVPLRLAGTGTAQLRVLRIGWYGGTGGRRVWGGAARLDGPVTALSLTTSGWPPGHYLIRADLGRATRAVPLTVRGPRLRDRTVVLATGRTARSFLRRDAGPVQAAERAGGPLAYLALDDVTARRLGLTRRVLTGAVLTADGRWPDRVRDAVRSAPRRGVPVEVRPAGPCCARTPEDTAGARR